MRIKAEINSKYQEMELHVCHRELDTQVRKVVGQLRALFDAPITGTDEAGNRVLIDPAEIISFFAEGQRVMAMDTKRRTFSIANKLYELEKIYEPLSFVRISKSEIVNYKKIRSLDMSITGTIKVIMKNGYETYTSRRNVSKIKTLLLQEKSAGGIGL